MWEGWVGRGCENHKGEGLDSSKVKKTTRMIKCLFPMASWWIEPVTGFIATQNYTHKLYHYIIHPRYMHLSKKRNS